MSNLRLKVKLRRRQHLRHVIKETFAPLRQRSKLYAATPKSKLSHAEDLRGLLHGMHPGWDWAKSVIVAWPREFSKVNKKIIKNSIDPSSIETTSCVAKILQFSGKCVGGY